MIGRLFYAIFFVLGGFIFAIPKWIIMGTKGSRDRKRMIKLQERQLREIAKHPERAAAIRAKMADVPTPPERPAQVGPHRLGLKSSLSSARSQRKQLRALGIDWPGFDR